MDTLVLLPSFIKFFGKAKNHSGSPGNLAVIFLAFGKVSSCVNYFHLHILVLHSHYSLVSYRLCALMQFLIWLLLSVFFVS